MDVSQESSQGQPDPGTVTRLLRQVRAGQPGAEDQLYGEVYAELRRLAGNLMGHERMNHTLQPTALVHETYVKLSRGQDALPEDREQLLRYASRAMRNLLVDYARGDSRSKRPPRKNRVEFAPDVALSPDRSQDLVSINEAFEELTTLFPDAAACFELWFFGGFKQREIADLLTLDRQRVSERIRMARAWLSRRLG